MIGTKLAHFEITSHLGTGGMVKCSGHRLQAGTQRRHQALPEVFTNDAERSAVSSAKRVCWHLRIESFQHRQDLRSGESANRKFPRWNWCLGRSQRGSSVARFPWKRRWVLPPRLRKRWKRRRSMAQFASSVSATAANAFVNRAITLRSVNPRSSALSKSALLPRSLRFPGLRYLPLRRPLMNA